MRSAAPFQGVGKNTRSVLEGTSTLPCSLWNDGSSQDSCQPKCPSVTDGEDTHLHWSTARKRESLPSTPPE